MATTMATVDSKLVWNPFDPLSKPNLLRVVRNEAEGLFSLAEPRENWERATASGHWQVRDIVGHMVDVTEGYLERFAAAREGREVATVGTLLEMSGFLDRHAVAFRSVPQDELLQRLRADYDRMIEVFQGLSDADWNGFIVTHGYMGPLPSMFYPTFHLIDYSVHSWDIREGLGQPQMMSADAADFLVPIMPILWQATLAPERLGGESIQVGVRVSGRNAQTIRMTASPEGLKSEPGPVDDLPCVLEFDPASLVLTAYGRMRAGTACGDHVAASRFSGLFFAI